MMMAATPIGQQKQKQVITDHTIHVEGYDTFSVATVRTTTASVVGVTVPCAVG